MALFLRLGQIARVVPSDEFFDFTVQAQFCFTLAVASLKFITGKKIER
jgi:hypothetical protein